MNILLKKININIDYSFILFSLTLLYIYQILTLFIIFISLFIHELFHILVYIYYKKKKNEVYKIELSISAFGGLASLDYKSFTKKEKIILFISGIVGNLFLILFKNEQLVFYNLILICFNILPIYPLDGFNIFKETKFYNDKNYKIIKIILYIIFFILFIFTKSLCVLFILSFLLYKNRNYHEEELKNHLNSLNSLFKKYNYDIERIKKI